MIDDYQFHYNSPRNPKCRNCGEQIKFDSNRIGKNGKQIPLNPYTDEPHRCKELIISQDIDKTRIDSDKRARIDIANQNKYPNRVRLDLPPQRIIAELSFPHPIEYDEIIAILDNLTNRVNNLTNRIEEIEQNQDRITEINPSSFANDDNNKYKSTTGDQNV